MSVVKLTPMRWFVILLLIATVLALALPPDPATLKLYHISTTTYRVIIALLLIPEALLWYACFFAYSKLLEYSRYLGGSKEHRAFKKITLGMGVLAYGLILPTIVSLLLSILSHHSESFKPSATIITNYISLLVVLISFSVLRGGTQILIESSRSIKRPSLRGLRMFALLFTVLAVFFTYATIHTHHLSNNAYRLSLVPLMLTIIIPYLYAWFEGLVCVYNFRLYSIYVKGVLYKKAFFGLSVGLLLTVIASIAMEFITSTIGARKDEPLGFVVLVLYIIIAIFLAGLGMMALGTKKLKKIEEV